MFIDDESIVNILSMDVMVQMSLDTSKLTLVKTHLIGIEEKLVLMEGVLDLLVIIDTYLKCCTL
jgi:hypothetical protein